VVSISHGQVLSPPHQQLLAQHRRQQPAQHHRQQQPAQHRRQQPAHHRRQRQSRRATVVCGGLTKKSNGIAAKEKMIFFVPIAIAVGH